MPFQDVEEISAEPIRTPSAVEKVLRRIFIEDWSLKLLSLAITLVLWLVVTSQNEPVSAHVNVQLNFVRPQALEISNDPPKFVDVTLTGSRTKLDNLSPLDLVATIDLTDQREGERVVRLAEKVQLTLPQGLRIVRFLPPTIPIRLEPIIDREIRLEPKISGEPADGYEIYSITPSQNTVVIRGPVTRVSQLDKAPTETVWLAGQKETFTASNVAIDIPDPKIDLLSPTVNIRIEIGEQRIEKTFTDVPVSAAGGANVEPAKATVTVLGPRGFLENLKPEEIKIVLNAESEPVLELPSALAGKLILRSTVPSKFTQPK
jgi:YbbR domain-containing protein